MAWRAPRVQLVPRQATFARSMMRRQQHHPRTPPGSPPMRPSVGEDLAQGGGEGVRLAHAAVFAAEESVVAAREGDGCRREPFGHGSARAADHRLARLRSAADDDAWMTCERKATSPATRSRTSSAAYSSRTGAGGVARR